MEIHLMVTVRPQEEHSLPIRTLQAGRSFFSHQMSLIPGCLVIFARLNAEAFCFGNFALCSSTEIADMHFRPGFKKKNISPRKVLPSQIPTMPIPMCMHIQWPTEQPEILWSWIRLSLPLPATTALCKLVGAFVLSHLPAWDWQIVRLVYKLFVLICTTYLLVEKNTIS